VERRYSHEHEDAGTRRNLAFDASPFPDRVGDSSLDSKSNGVPSLVSRSDVGLSLDSRYRGSSLLDSSSSGGLPLHGGRQLSATQRCPSGDGGGGLVHTISERSDEGSKAGRIDVRV